MPDSFPAAIVRKVLSAHNPALDVPYLARLRALYDGGYSLLHNPTVLAELFPACVYIYIYICIYINRSIGVRANLQQPLDSIYIYREI